MWQPMMFIAKGQERMVCSYIDQFMDLSNHSGNGTLVLTIKNYFLKKVLMNCMCYKRFEE